MTTSSILRKTILLFSITVICLQLSAQDFSLPKQYNGRRHRGFFLSMALGVNSTKMESDAKYYGLSTYKGIGGAFDLKIGGTLTENLILHATILSHGVTGPKVSSDEFNINDVKTDNDISLSEGMIGAGLTYYTGSNIFFSSSLGMGNFILENDKEDISISTDWGFSMQLKAGKEWWVGKKWGIGVAAYYHHTNGINQEGNIAEEKLSSHNFGIMFNATLNGRK
ncbi:hypothetical protein [Carboxylicivirga sp. RSCT41]|uniref:hypothetical protein n=1 Tax=Carboxylicivirga agarovorans TaxID=3417570 RepID=UPI003D3543A1